MFCHCCCNIITFWMFCSHDEPSIFGCRLYLPHSHPHPQLCHHIHNGPVFSLVLDEDVSADIALMYPELYQELMKVRMQTRD